MNLFGLASNKGKVFDLSRSTEIEVPLVMEPRVLDRVVQTILSPKHRMVISGLDSKSMEKVRELPPSTTVLFTVEIEDGETAKPRLFRIRRRDYKRNKVWLDEL